ncbi:MAG: hypothetical protein L0Y54_00335 [Sporichthyaceae bacterium]|nr:hypothetical protein [Sporichthyaceae bacterium]
MSTTGEPTGSRQFSPWATGFALFAATAMIVLGVFHALMGLTALINDEFYARLRNYTFDFDLTGWGWIHLISGIIIAIAGYSLLSGALWARIVGIVLAALSAIVNFLWLPYYPVWSIIAIALAFAVIWALSRIDENTMLPGR